MVDDKIKDKSEKEAKTADTLEQENTQENKENETDANENENLQNEKRNVLAEEYLNLARVIQADFDNYRKRSLQQIENARIDGISSSAQVLLPSLDAIKKVKESLSDEKTLEGIEMLEKSILAGFEKLGIKKIETIGLPLDPNFHNALAVGKDETKEDGIILDEFQSGYVMDGKIIRYAQVLVNKL